MTAPETGRADEVAWRNKRRGKAHRVADKGYDTACGYSIPLTDWEQVALAHTAPEDRCRWCFPPESDEASQRLLDAPVRHAVTCPVCVARSTE